MWNLCIHEDIKRCYFTFIPPETEILQGITNHVSVDLITQLNFHGLVSVHLS